MTYDATKDVVEWIEYLLMLFGTIGMIETLRILSARRGGLKRLRRR